MDIDLSALKNINLSALKKHMSLVIPGIIVVVSLLLLIPTVIVGNSLKEKMKKSSQQARQVSSLYSDSHPFADSEREKQYQDYLSADAEKLGDIAKQSTQRELISYDIFPEPSSSSIQLFSIYGKQYRQSIEELLMSIGARRVPTDDEIKRELIKRGAKLSKSSTSTTSRSNRKSGRGRQSQDITKALTDAFLKKHAEQIPVYANPKVFNWYGFWENYEVEDPEKSIKDCWYSQLAFWVYEDVVSTIGKINAGSDSIFKSDVKRLIGVSFRDFADYAPETSTGYRGASMSRMSNYSKTGDYPEYVVSEEDDSIFGFPPPAKRTCDDKIDVIYFNVAVIIDSSAVFPFIEELCGIKEHKFKGYPEPDQEEQTFKHNQISVLQYWQESLDREDKVHEKYRYGDGAVVKLSLTCEYILDRGGYDVIKPASIHKALKETLEAIEKSKKQTNMMF